MQVRIEDVSPVEKKLIVEIPWTTVSDRLASAYRELSKSVNLRGFRKGKVPKSMLQRMYGKHVHAEVAQQFLREGFLTATAEHKLDAVSEPHIHGAPDIKTGQPLAMEATFEVKGDVVAKDYDGMELRKRRLDVPEEAVDQSLEALQRAHTELLPIEGRDVTARTDMIVVKISGTVGDEVVEQPNVPLDLGDPEREPLPGLLQALTGLPIHVEDHDIELTVPEDHPEEMLRGKTARLRISIVEARKKEVPALDDEFAKDLDRGETLAELRQSVRSDLEQRQAEEIKREVRDAALKELVKRNQIPVASALIERGIEFHYGQMQAMLGSWGMQGQDMPLTDSMRERLRPTAVDTVRAELLLEAVGTQENIDVTEDEVQERVSQMAKARNMPVARLRAELERDDEMSNIRYQARREKILDALVARATVVEVDASELRAHEDHDHEGHDHEGHDHDHEGHSHSHEGHSHSHEGHSHEGHSHGHEGRAAEHEGASPDEPDRVR